MTTITTAVGRDRSTGEELIREGLGRSQHQILVVAQREWNAWRTGMFLLADLEDVHWAQPTGSPHPLIHAYVRCTRIVSGQIPHDCQPAGSPCHVLVCLLKCHAVPSVFEELARRADARGATRPPRAAFACTADGSATHPSHVSAVIIWRVAWAAIALAAAIGVVAWRRR